VYLDDDKVFMRDEQSNMGDLSVDILLDASTSQKDRQETVSSQGYIIAESLTKCGIPCRVMSFCSMTGYTIVRIFRDYNEPARNKHIFEYVSNGCNRDGLAIKAAHWLMGQSSYEHKILIVLSDVQAQRHPQDARRRRGRIHPLRGRGRRERHRAGGAPRPGRRHKRHVRVHRRDEDVRGRGSSTAATLPASCLLSSSPTPWASCCKTRSKIF
jgi:hypothetical protein